MTEHTPEPWVAITGGRLDPEVIITTQCRLGESLGEICGMNIEFTGQHGIEQKANARRIVAAVNACAGIPTDLLEEFNDWSAAGVASSATYRQQRDELMAALEKVTAKLAWLNSDDCGHIMALTDESEALIASVKGGAA